MCVSRYASCAGKSGRDMTPRQASLSGVIICPAYHHPNDEDLSLGTPDREGQRLRVNSITTDSITAGLTKHVNSDLPVAGLERMNLAFHSTKSKETLLK